LWLCTADNRGHSYSNGVYGAPKASKKPPLPCLPQGKKRIASDKSFIDIFVISGLSVLFIGGLLISAALLMPLLRRRTVHRCEEPIKYFGSEVYVKSKHLPLAKSGAPSVDLGFHKDVVPGDVALRKIQAECVKSEPVDLTAE